MSISWYEEFIGHDWERYSKLSSKATCCAAVALGAISIFLGFSMAVSVWTLLSGVLIAIWEFPFIFYLIPNFEAGKTFLMETVNLKYEEARAILFCGLAIFTMMKSTPCMVVGMMLVVSAVLLVFASINRRADAAAAAAGGPSAKTPDSSSHGDSSLLGAASKFGTF